jgi:GMP synthase (glutamine-hydrolysing)
MTVLVFEHSAITGSLRLAQRLRQLGYELDVRALHQGDAVPRELDDITGIIAFGGDSSANDEQPAWIDAEIALLRKAHEAAIPVLGICLGSQLLTKALGGRVAVMLDGIEFGWHGISVNQHGQDDALLSGLPAKFMIFSHHREWSAELPPGAQVLASSSRCSVQAYKVGASTYGLQFHPEYDTDTIAASVRQDHADVAESGISVDQVLADSKRYYLDMQRWSDEFFDAIAKLFGAR